MMKFHSKGDYNVAKITNVDLETTEFIVRKKTLSDREWIEVWWKVANDDGSDCLVWEGPIYVWLSLRVLFNEMFSLLSNTGDRKQQAFPAHDMFDEHEGEDWP
jgi:hypothetical protein